MAVSKPQLILLHGALGNASTMVELASALDGTLEVHCPDLPGHGRLSNAPYSDILTLVAYLDSYIREHRLEKPIVFGYSLGGYVALSYALSFPDHLGRVVTFATKFAWNPDEAERQVKLLNADVIESKVPAFAQLLKERHGEHHWRTVLSSTTRMMLQLGQQPLVTSETVRNISIPVCIAVGSDDQMVTREESWLIAQAIPDAEFKLIDGLPHAIEKIPGRALAALVEDCSL